MKTKEQAYRAHAFLQARGVNSLKRSHIHELLAASVGYATYAAFQHDAAWCNVPFGLAGLDVDTSALQTRCAELGVPPDESRLLVEALPEFLYEAGYAPMRFAWLIAAADGYEHDPDWHDWVWMHVIEPARGWADAYVERQRVLLEALEAAAQRSVPSAHLAIAKLLEPEVELWDDEEEQIRRQGKREGTWTSPFVSFADIEADGMLVEAKYRHHLLAAARAGDLRGLMETAECYGDPAILERSPSEAMDPRSMASIAADLGFYDKEHYWLTVAAQEGDVSAMRGLILDFDEPAEQAWVWMHLSRLLGDNLSRDRFEAINEDGTPYDDDIGGPAYVGGDEGINLDPLVSDADAAARQKAAELFALINADRDHI